MGEVREIREERMLQWFTFTHDTTPAHMHEMARHYLVLADFIVTNMESGPERTVALRKLLESKDSAVRSKMLPGG